MDDARTQAKEAARLVRQGLTQLGQCYETKDGRLVEVSFASVQFVEDAYALVEVDTRRLPPRVTIPKLVHPDTLHHLTAVVGKPVKRLNTTGLTYCVALKPQRKQRLPKMVEVDLAHRPPGDYVIGFGLSREGEVWKSLEKLRHIVVAGSTDSGKSAFLRSLLYQLLKQPLPVELYLTDMEGLTFAAFEGVPQLAHPIAESVEEATEIAFRLVQEMERRAALYQATGRFPEKLSEYNGLGELNELPWIVAIFDEFTALIDEAGKHSDLYRLIGQLAMRGRKYGITLVFAGQDFKADLLSTRITNQLRTRVQFGCATAYQSQVVLGKSGAEKITTPGRALVSFGGKITEVQTFWVDKERVLGLRRGAASPLAGDEQELVHYASEELGGKFNIRDLAEAFRGRVSQRQIERLSRQWEMRGWLSAGPTRADGKRITAELASLVGKEQKSEDSDGA
ncbi:MAG: FtsK/SpoIIIE domain-containing protein [Anaerolineae bacterium]|nr:FtsK/SpoIIIE domain-containing protein [Anaerolineae bacterium]